MALEALTAPVTEPGKEEKAPYVRPLLIKLTRMDFPLEILSKATNGIVCKQCSSCHACR